MHYVLFSRSHTGGVLASKYCGVPQMAGPFCHILKYYILAGGSGETCCEDGENIYSLRRRGGDIKYIQWSPLVVFNLYRNRCIISIAVPCFVSEKLIMQRVIL